MNKIVLIIARILLLLILAGLAIAPVIWGLSSLPAAAAQTVAMLFLFGVWSIGCVGLGAWLMRRREAHRIVDITDPASVYRFIRDGGKPKQAPAVPGEESMSDLSAGAPSFSF